MRLYLGAYLKAKLPSVCTNQPIVEVLAVPLPMKARPKDQHYPC